MDFIQLKDSYHFSSDAILLAEFINQRIVKNLFEKKRHIKPPFLMLDVGCGCGVIGLLVLEFVKKNYPEILDNVFMLGIDKNKDLVDIAKQNAEKFGLSKQYQAITLDIELFNAKKQEKNLVQEWAFTKIEPYLTNKSDGGIFKNPRFFDVIMTNPPWYLENSGINSQAENRKNALFGNENTLKNFINFSYIFIKHHRYLYMVGRAMHLIRYLHNLPKSLQCLTVQNIHAQKQKNATFFLLETCFQSKADLIVAPPIFLQ